VKEARAKSDLGCAREELPLCACPGTPQNDATSRGSNHRGVARRPRGQTGSVSIDRAATMEQRKWLRNDNVIAVNHHGIVSRRSKPCRSLQGHNHADAKRSTSASGPELRSLIDRAAKARGTNRTDFVLEAAQQEAEDVLLDRALISVSQKAYAEFLKRLDAPGKPDARLRRTMKAPSPGNPAEPSGRVVEDDVALELRAVDETDACGVRIRDRAHPPPFASPPPSAPPSTGTHASPQHTCPWPQSSS
jgi:uncharacterized protein (DUF1778 family)